MPSSKGKMSDGRAMRLLQGLRTGKTLGQLRDTPRRFEVYCDSHPQHTVEARKFSASNTEAARLRLSAHQLSKTHCPHLLITAAQRAVCQFDPLQEIATMRGYSLPPLPQSIIAASDGRIYNFCYIGRRAVSEGFQRGQSGEEFNVRVSAHFSISGATRS
jgi:hypothetical protein